MPVAPDLCGSALDGRYELHSLLGEGAFGRVYRGFDRRLERTVAVKVIKPWWAEDTAWVERFEREARMLARISDPGIVHIYDIGHAEEGPYYVAELVDGESLDERLRRGPLAPGQARRIAEQLCRALAAAHERGVVHCDVKPANVLLAADGSVKVGDFGVARLAEGTSQAHTGTVAGTPRYMSPEQARGRPTSPATDVYSAGIVLYEMLAGEPPFSGGSPVELGLRHVQEEPAPLPSRVPDELRAIVERALVKEPRGRYPDGAAMADALARVAGDDDGAGAYERDETIDLAGAETVPAAALATRVLGGENPTVARRGPDVTIHRRRRLGLAAAVAAAGVLAAVLLLRSGSRTTVPDLQGMRRTAALADADRSHLEPTFAVAYSSSPAGVAVAQSPAAGARVGYGSKVHIVLSAGPPPVTVPRVVGLGEAAAEQELTGAGLRYSVTAVPSLSVPPGQVAAQHPAQSASAPRGSTVSLRVGESRRWRPLTSFSGTEDGQSVTFQILGARWRVSYSMSYEGTCNLLIVCFGPSAEATRAGTGSSAGGFELGEGSGQEHIFDTGPGLYRIAVTGGQDSARWSMTVEDYY